MSIRHYLIYSVLLCTSAVTLAQGQGITLESGLYYSEGDYHRDSPTHIKYIPVAAKYQHGKLQFKISGGWLSLKGPGHIEAGTQTASEYDEHGWADSYLSSGYLWQTPWLKHIDWLAPELKIKFPTADKNKALGTGAYDSQLLLGFYRIRAHLTLHSTLSHRWRGDRSDLNMHDSWGFNFGGVWKLNKFLDTGLMFDTEQASSAQSYAKREMIFHISVKISKRVKTTYYSQLGLDKGSPDFSLGTQIGYGF